MKSIIITSIFEPTDAVKKFSIEKNHNLYVVGDKKTPSNWNWPNVNYISVEDQQNSNFHLAKVLPFNHYCRKMLGYLQAIRDGAEVIIDTDDDNIPYDDWTFPDFTSEFDHISANKGFVNIYQLFTKEKIWPRGLPLRLINTEFSLENQLSKKKSNVGIWQGLADEDPDVDAIYRLTNNKPCYFEKRNPIVLGENTIAPINTQNTLIKKELFPLLYLPTYVTFRYTDILRGLVAQPIMWAAGYQLGFTDATVIQKRNEHDYMKDFVSEIPMYESGEKVIELVSKVISVDNTISNNLFNSYQELLKNNIVEMKEMKTLEAWLKDLQETSDFK